MNRNFFEKLSACNPNEQTTSLTVIDGPYIGEKAIVNGGRAVWFSSREGWLSGHWQEIGEGADSLIVTHAGVRVFREVCGRPKTIVVMGCGHVGNSIIRAAKFIGCRVLAIDDRSEFAELAQAAGADEVICSPFNVALADVKGSPDTFFVVVTRGHRFDEDCLRAVCTKPHAYIGMMGAKRRVAIVKETLRREGIDEAVLAGVCSPIGLDIRSETPEEIAIAVLAEIIAHKNAHQTIVYPADIVTAVTGAHHGTPYSGRMILCSIVSRKGSAPRGVGSRMLVMEDGSAVGTIGGGCTEAGVFEKAHQIFGLDLTETALIRVDLTADEAAEEGEVCGGIVEVLLEKLPAITQ